MHGSFFTLNELGVAWKLIKIATAGADVTEFVLFPQEKGFGGRLNSFFF